MFIFDRGFILTKNAQGDRLRIGSLTRTTVKDLVDGQPAPSQFQFPIKFVGGKQRLSGLAEGALFDGRIMGELFFNTTPAPGSTKFTDTAVTLAGASVTSTPPTGYAWAEDMGVVNCDTNRPLTNIVGSPAAGQHAGTHG